ncbi:MAG: HPF/RaiA family ribosome-associated protein [Bdellovibrionales bacterium]|nr:HPF/RaiA family ribosome-associated protein [Bdellovibrionales bacterium]
MIRIHFKNLDKSEMARDAVTERIQPIVEKFPDLYGSRIQIILEMQNSPHQAGPDLFTVRLHVHGGRYDSVHLEKSASNLYLALADLVDYLLEKLNRFGDRMRVKQRTVARRVANAI